MEGGTTSLSLLDRCRDRDPEAWSRLVRVYGPLVYSWARRTGLQDADAANVVQETFQKVFGAIGEFRRDRADDTFRGWLWTITRNNVRDLLRQRRERTVERGVVEALVQEDADEPDPNSDGARLFLRAAESLRGRFAEHTWRAFWRCAVEGDRPDDVAADLGVSVASVYQAKSRLLRHLRATFEGLVDE